MRLATASAASVLLALAVSGCMGQRMVVMPPAVPDPTLEAGGTCNAEGARFLLGKTIDERLGETARVRSGARLVRVLRPNLPADEDRRESRLDVEVDSLGQAIAVRCG